MAIKIRGETTDTLLGGRVQIVQPRHGYRVAIDSVLLASAVAAKPAQTILDVGAGTGAASFCLLARMPDLQITALEADPSHLRLLRQGIETNGFGDRIEAVEGDLAAPPVVLKRRQFDHVITNPPYHAAGAHRRPDQLSRSVAGHESLPLTDWLNACARQVRSGGHLTLIHRADRLDEIMSILANRFGGITIVPFWPRAGAGSASRVIVIARKGARAPARLCSGLVVHQDDGRFTATLERILRHAEALATVMEGKA